MNTLESIQSAISSVFANKMRSILTMLGIIIGISSVIMITSVGNGFKNSLTDTFSQMGVEGLKLLIKENKEIKDSDYFKMEDAEFLKQNPNIKYVAPSSIERCSIKLKGYDEAENCMAFGTSEDYRYSASLDVLHGRFITDSDVKSKNNIVVISDTLSRKIFGTEDSVGEKITVKLNQTNMNLAIVGVFKTQDMFASMGMSMVYVPITSLLKTSSTAVIYTMLITAYDKDKLNDVGLEAVRLMEIRHNAPDKYYIQNVVQTMDQITNTLNMVTTFIVLVAAISLLVGGIGVMNIMLVTVTERTREIGIRKSIGATDSNIKFQFLVEAMILTCIGGVLGIALGYLGGNVVGKIANIKPYITLSSVFVTVAISCGIGIVFGVYPAGKAAKLDPIEALRYE